ncbi:hypothetical protein [uncultured Brevundimonas sp.]|uniref:hypothetical protein n=1 Tax=uncultured Brevundimonas sp. TaxID=213418 RepID=UPI0025F7737B|nr:hypothetical protein [uncultured Brevundimonas sp.]
MDLSAFKASNANTPAFCHFKDLDDQPIYTDKKEPVGVYLLGQDSDTLTALANQQTNRFLNQRTPGAGVTAEKSLSNTIDFLAAATTDFQNITFGGETWPCDDEHTRKLYREVPIFRIQAERFVRDRGNWQKVSPKT